MALNNQQLAKIDQFKNVINSQTIRAQVRNSLKEHAGAFLSGMIDLYSGDNTLMNCDPEKVALECVKAAALGLPISKALGFAYVVPYKNVPTFTIGYKGLIQLAQRTGQYQRLNADVVYEGELISRDKMTGWIDMSGEATSQTVVGYFAYFKLINGFEKIFFMTKEKVEEWRDKYSPSANASFSPWKSEFDKMALKTVLKRLISVYGPMSTEMADVIAAEENHEDKVNRNIDANANIIEIDGAELTAAQPDQAQQLPEGTPPATQPQAEIIPPAGF